MTDHRTKKIGRYEVLGELGRGGFGRVYRCFDPTVGRPVALKVLSDVSNDMLTRFRNEAKVAGNLRHNNIVTIYEYGTHDGAPFLAMEYLEGEDLQHLIASRRPLSLLDKCSIMAQVADGLLYAHNQGVIHRDMKPANIMVLRDGTAKIMDFGIARLTRTPDATRLTQEGYLIGTLRYMAPEQLASAEFDARSDIFAYGVIYYELLAGKHPFDAPDAQSLMYKLSFEDPAAIADLAPGVPQTLQQVIQRTVQKNRERRYQNLAEIKFDTEPIRIELQKARAAELLLQARPLVEQQLLEPAQKVLEDTLVLDPSNTAARELWENVQQSLQKRILQPRIEGLLRAAEDHLAGRRFTEAAEAFASALALDPRHSYIRGRLDEARALVDHSQRADQLLAEARREFEQKNLTAAYRIVSEALQYDPRHPEAAEFLKAIETYMECRQAEQRVEDAVRKVQSLLLIPAYDEAIAVLAAADQRSPKIREWLQRIEGEKASYERVQKLRREMAEATDLLRNSRFEEAAQRLQALREDFPDEREIADLLAYAQREQTAAARARTVQRAAAEAKAYTEQTNFDGALAALEAALKDYPDESKLLRLLSGVAAEKRAWEREQAVEAAIVVCESLRSQVRFQEAMEAIRRALASHSGEPRLASLARQIEEEWNQARRNEAVQQISRRAEELMTGMQPEAALAALQDGLKEYPGDALLEKALKRTQEQLRARKKAREAERAASIDQAGREARARAAAGQFDEALQLLDEGLKRWPDAAALSKLRVSTVADRDQSVKHARAVRELNEIRQSALLRPGTPDAGELLALTSRIGSESPNDPEVQAIATDLIGLLSDLVRARQFLVQRNFPAVLDTCSRRLQQYPECPAYLELQREAQHGRKQSRIQDLQRRAASEPDLKKRCGILEQGVKEHPGEAALADELRIVRNKLALVELIVRDARAEEQSGNWEEAMEKWKSLLTVYPDYPGLKAQIELAARAAKQPVIQPAVPEPRTVARPALPPQPPTRRPKSRRRIRAMIAGGAAAASLAGGIIVLRARRPSEMPAAAPDRTPTVVSAPPAVLPSTAPPQNLPAVIPERAGQPESSAKASPPARLEISDVVPGTSVRVDGVLIGETDRNGALRREVPPGMHTIEFSEQDYTSVRLVEQFRSGKPLRLDRTRVTMTAVTKPAPAPVAPAAPLPDPRQVEAQDWALVANSANPEDFENLIRNHPGGAYLDQARTRAADLRQQMRVRAAQQLEHTAWEKADQKNREQMEDYLSRFPAGLHAQEARARVAEMDRQAAEALAARRSREQKEQEQANRAADQQAIEKVLAEFEAAYNKRDLEALRRIWSAVPANTYRSQFREARQLKFRLQPTGMPEVDGTSAVIVCTRTLSHLGQSGGVQTVDERVRVTLQRESAGWVIRSVEAR